MDSGSLGRIIGVGLVVLVGGGYYLLRQHRANSYGGSAKATVLRHENPLNAKPYEVRVVFAYEVDGVRYEGSAIRPRDKAPAVDATLYIQYKIGNPGKYYVP